jgi:hypothetical protein
MIQGYGNEKEPLKFFEQMKQEMNHPDSVTFVALLNALSHIGFVETLKYFHKMKEEYQKFLIITVQWMH